MSTKVAFRSNEMMKILKGGGGDDNLIPGLKETLEKCVPDSKIVMVGPNGPLRRPAYSIRESGQRGWRQQVTRRSWKPNVQDKRLFSYILDRHILVKVATHALHCIDNASRIDEYLLKTPYQKMDTELVSFGRLR
ncbi:Large ribosomal subunit protein bL28-like protein [Drosera capensis]